MSTPPPRSLRSSGWSRSSPCRCGGRWKRLAFRATFYRWYDLYQAGGPEALDDRHPKPDAAPQPAPLPQTSPQSVARSIKKLAPELLTITEPAPIRLQTGHS